MIVYDEGDGVKRIIFGTRPTAEKWRERQIIISNECREQVIDLGILTQPILKLRREGWRLKKIVRWPDDTDYVFWKGHHRRKP